MDLEVNERPSSVLGVRHEILHFEHWLLSLHIKTGPGGQHVYQQILFSCEHS